MKKNPRVLSRRPSSPLPLCFRPAHRHSSTEPNPITSLYHTHIGLFILTWSTNLFGRSLHLHLLPGHHYQHDRSLSCSPSLDLSLKPFLFWNNSGSRPLSVSSSPDQKLTVFWDFTRAKFSSGPEPVSGFYIAVVSDNGEMTLLVGDSEKAAYLKTKAIYWSAGKNQALVVRREHVFGTRVYTTKASFGGKTREISIECDPSTEDPCLCIGFDEQRVVQVKHLKWKFRGNEKVEVDGNPVQLSWDVYNWIVDDGGCALFTFRFEEEEGGGDQLSNRSRRMLFWSNDNSCGLNFERKKMKRKLLMMNARSSSSSSSSASSGCGSVMEWESVEENELKGPSGFSLLLYAWKN